MDFWPCVCFVVCYFAVKSLDSLSLLPTLFLFDLADVIRFKGLDLTFKHGHVD